MENNAQRENVAFRHQPISPFARNYFRSHIAWSTTPVKDIVLRVNVHGKAKVNDDWVKSSFSSQHNVFRFEVSVHDVEPVDLVEGLAHSPEKEFDFLLREVGHFLVDSGVELAVGKEF